MDIAMLGTGAVGQTIGAKLVMHGHRVCMGSRTADNVKAAGWAETQGDDASSGAFEEAAAFGEVVFNCTAGAASLAALAQAGAHNLHGKILIDVSNPLDFSKGFPPSLTVCNTDSLAEQIQRAFPGTRVVKTLNTMNAAIMVDPAIVPGPHHVFVSGDDPAARDEVARMLHEWFGWDPPQILDLGDLSTARGTEMLLPVWVRLWKALGHAEFNFHIARQRKEDA